MTTTSAAKDLAIVTGASRGIGLAIARQLTGAGLDVVMLARGEDALRAAARELGANAIPIACDVRLAEALESAAAHVRERYGTPRVIVNNAGIFPLAPVERTTIEAFTEAISTNLVAPFVLVRAFLPEMRSRGIGHIITIGSIADHVAFSDNGAYAASKFGLRGLHEVLRAELRGSGVRTTLISPGAVDTHLWDAIDPDSRAGFTPRKAMLSPEAVAEAVAFAITRPPQVNIDELRVSAS